MTAYETIMSRRSIKKYKDTPVPEEIIDQILEAGTYAPTAGGRQSPLIVYVGNAEDKAEVERLNMVSIGRDPGTPFYGAPNLAVVFAARGNANGVQDASLVAGNMLHAAHALGVGACWINRAKECFNCDEGKALMVKWGLNPDEWEGVANIIIGYPDHDPQPAPRKEGYIVKV